VARGARCGLITLAIFGAPASAQEQTEGFSLTSSAVAGYSSNPFLERDPVSSAYAELAATPRYLMLTERSQSALEGRFRLTKYFQNFGTSKSYGLSARHNQRVSEQLTVNGELLFDDSVVGERRDILGVAPPLSGPLPEPGDDLEPDPDAAVEGLRQRRTTYRASGGFSLRRSELDTIGVDGAVERVSFPSTGTLTSYWSQSVSGRYTRALSSVSSLGGAISAQRYVYDGDGGHFSIISPQLVYVRRLGPFWSIDAAAGALFVRGRMLGASMNSIDVSANLSACRRTERADFCVLARRDATASGFGGARKTSRGQLTYSYRLRDRQTIDLALSAATSSGSGIDRETARSISASAGYRREVSTRLTVGASVDYRTASNAIVGRARDAQARVSLGYRFGSLR
jgi:hypothetical protein